MKEGRILVVDDEKNIRLTLRQVLEGEGLRVETASNGAEALEKIRASRDFDLMMLDLSMPKMGGMDVLRELQAMDVAFPVVVFTAHGSAGNATEAMKLGATDFAEKPFSPAQIRALVEQFGAARPEQTAAEDDEAAAEKPPRHTYRTLVLVTDAASAEALLPLAAASAHSHEHSEVVVAGLAREPADRSAPLNLSEVAGQAKVPGVTMRTRPAEGRSAEVVLPALAEEEAPDHVLLQWSGPPAEARALNALAQRLADENGCDVTLVRPAAEPAAQRVAAIVDDEPYALAAVRRALEFAKRAGVASLTLLNAQPTQSDDEENPSQAGHALIHKVARKAGLPQDKYYTQVAVAEDVAHALPRVAEDFDFFCVSAAHAEALIPALFDEDTGSHIAGTIALVRSPAQASPSATASFIQRIIGG